MTWYDLEDILYDGTKTEIENIFCPNCEGKISYRFSDKPRSFEVSCRKCGYLSRATGGPIPKSEIAYAKAHGKKVNYLENV